MNILKSIIKKDLPENIKYIYAPLHFQPEMSTMGMAKILWDDQATLIEFIAAKLPEDVYIITKEHWLQSFHQRSDLFYQRLAETKKVIFAPIETPSSILLEGALAAATTTGTVGWEALASKKPVIYAGYPSYSQITGAFKINENLNIEEVLNYKIDYELLKIEINNLASTAYYGLINPPFPTNQDKYNENINHLIYAYMNYIDEFLNKNPDYKQNIKNKIDALKIKTQVISSMSVNDDIKACLPDISFFTNKKYKIIDKNKKNKLKYITKKIFYKLFKK